MEAGPIWYLSEDWWREIFFNWQWIARPWDWKLLLEEFYNLRLPSENLLYEIGITTIIPISEIKLWAFDHLLGIIPEQCSWTPHYTDSTHGRWCAFHDQEAGSFIY